MHKHLRIALIVAILIPSTSLAYYFTVFLPKNEQTKLEIQKQQSSAPAQDKGSETPSAPPVKTINSYVAPRVSKNIDLEIEKCKAKLTVTETEDSEDVTNSLNEYWKTEEFKTLFHGSPEEMAAQASKMFDDSLEAKRQKRYRDCLNSI